MDLLLYLFAFLRPILFIDIGIKVGGLNMLEISAIFLALLLIALLIFKIGVKKKIYISSIDILIIFFTFWCIAVYLSYSDDADIKKVVKIILPLWSFIVVKNVIQTKDDYQKLIFIALIGFSIPLVISVVMIVSGKGLGWVSYWTSIGRYKGAYADIHMLGHNMALLIMMIVAYITIRRYSFEHELKKLHVGKKLFFSILILLALYCLYKCWTRTQVLGLIVFFIAYYFYYNKKVLISGVIGVITLGILFAPIIVPRYFHDVQRIVEGELDPNRLGSGRVEFWADTLKNYVKLPIDRKLAGNGLGNPKGLSGRYLDTHSDVLGLLEEVGLVGFILYMLLQLFILKRILSLEGDEKYYFIAFFTAVFAMNLVSNSYISRFGIAQMYFLMLAYIEIPFLKNKSETKVIEH